MLISERGVTHAVSIKTQHLRIPGSLHTESHLNRYSESSVKSFIVVDTDRQTDRQTDTQTDTQTHIHTNTSRHTNTHTHTHAHTHTHTHTHKQTHRHTQRQTDRNTRPGWDRWKERVWAFLSTYLQTYHAEVN